MDVRNGLMTQEEGFEMAKKKDSEKPDALKYYLEITGMSEEEFFEKAEKHKHALLKNKKLPVVEGKKPNKESTVPFVQEFIKEMQAKGDPREE